MHLNSPEPLSLPDDVSHEGLPGNRTRHRLRFIGRVIVALAWCAILALIAWTGWRSRSTILPYLLVADYLRFLLAIPFYLGTLVTAGVGWSLIMRSLAKSVDLWSHLRIFYVTLAARRLPGTVWYVGGRLMAYRQIGISGTAVTVASAVELFVTTVAGIIVGLTLVPLGLTVPRYMLVLLFVGAVAGGLCLHPSVLTRIMRRLGQPLPQPVRSRDLLSWLIAYAATWVAGGLMVGIIAGAFWQLDARQLILIVGAWALSGAGGTLTLFLPSSFGVAELALVLFLSRLMPLTLAVTVAILIRILTTLAEVVLSVGTYPFLKRMIQVPAAPPRAR